MTHDKHYLFNFIGGGWNSTWAPNKRTAIKATKTKYINDTVCIPDYNTFRVSTESDYNNLLNQFN